MPVEEPVLVLSPSRVSFLKEYGIIIFFILLYFFLGALSFELPPTAGYAMLGIILFFITYVEVFKLSHIYKITPSQVVAEHGIVKKKRDSVFLNSISDVKVHQGYLSRFLHIGTVSVGPASGADAIKMVGIRNPKKIALELEKLIHAYGGGRAPKEKKEAD